MHCPPIARRISHARLDYADIRQTSEMLETFAECFLSTLDLHDLPCLISRTFDHFCSAHSAAIVLCLLCRISILQRVCSVSIVCSATHLPWTPEKKASRFRSHRLVIPITSKTQTQGMEETYNRKPSLLRSVLLPLTPEKRASRFRSLRSYSYHLQNTNQRS
jgi:hypothetical protein